MFEKKPKKAPNFGQNKNLMENLFWLPTIIPINASNFLYQTCSFKNFKGIYMCFERRTFSQGKKEYTVKLGYNKLGCERKLGYNEHIFESNCSI